MACCGGGSRPRSVRHQAIPIVQKQTVDTVVQKRISQTQIKQISTARQYLMPREQCIKCGYPLMLVNIANRERLKCSNTNCGELK